MKTCAQCHKEEISGFGGDFCDPCSAYRREQREQCSCRNLFSRAVLGEDNAKCAACLNADAASAHDARKGARKAHDAVDHPAHYNAHPSGVECIAITEHMSFCVGNAIKYLWRADEKGRALEDLRKAAWYIEREVARRQASP